MQVNIKRFDKSLPLPEYKTDGAAAFDLYSRLDAALPAGEVTRIPLNIAIQMPPDYFAFISARSSLHKRGLMLANGIGIGDYDYRGDTDEYHAALYNFSNKLVRLKKGERIVQMVILPRERASFIEQDSFDHPDRGGFGSTGIS